METQDDATPTDVVIQQQLLTTNQRTGKKINGFLLTCFAQMKQARKRD